MDHKWLEDFLMLARERSFSKAAALRYVTQPQLSRRIRSLELWCGAELVNRSSVPLSLTPEGDSLLSAARSSVQVLNDIRERIRQSHNGDPWVTVFTGRTLSCTALPRWLGQVRQRLGSIQLRIMTGSLHDGAVALEQGGANFLLCCAHPKLQLALDEQQFEYMNLGRDELLAISAPLPNGQAMHALPGNEKKPVPVLGFAPSLALAQILQDALIRSSRLTYKKVVMESDFAESLLEQAMQGTGVAWLPRTLVAEPLRLGRLVLAGQDAPIPYAIRLYRQRHERNVSLQNIWTASTPQN